MLNFRNLSVGRKMVIFQMITALIATLTCIVLFLIITFQSIRNSQDKAMTSIAKVIAKSSESSLEFYSKSVDNEELNAPLQYVSSVTHAAIINKDGEVFSSYQKNKNIDYQFDISNLNGTYENKIDNGNFSDYYYRIEVDEVERISDSENDNRQKVVKQLLGHVLLRVDNSDQQNILRQYFIAGLVILVISFLLALPLSYFLQKSISNPIDDLVSVLKKVSVTKNYKLKADESGQDEIAILSKEFNDMMHQIEEQDQSLKQTKDELELRVEQRTSELKNINEELEGTNRELEQFAYIASHDLQEPLRSVGSFTQLLSRRYKDQLDGEAKEFIHYIVDGVGRMQNLIKDLLLFSRLGRLGVNFSNININKLLDKIELDLRFAIQESNVVIERKELPVLVADTTQLVHLFQNLISNAIKFRGEDNPIIKIDYKDQDSHYLFSVKDNGIGISKEYADKIFIIFQRLHTKDKYPGTGVGLAICKKIVELHGGKIWFESEMGIGTTFYFTLKKLNLDLK